MIGDANGRVILLTSAGLPHRIVAAAVARELPLIGIVVERGQTSTAGLAGGLDRLARTLLGDAFYQRARAFKRSLGKPQLEKEVERIEAQLRSIAEAELLTSLGTYPPVAWPDAVEILEVAGVNDERAVEWCRERRPDLVLVYGTSILRAPMIRVPTQGVLNAHSSMLPDYRGVFSEFWQTLHGRLETAGVTIHFIDEGVDTGDIVLQVRTACEPGIDPYRIRSRNVAATAEAYPRAAREVLGGYAEPRRQEASDAPAFRSRDLTLDKRVELLRQLGHDL